MNNHIEIASFISKKEASCPCGCGKTAKPSFLNKINALRTIVDFPFKMCFSRCRQYNDKVGGSKNSAHLSDEAVDISCANPIERAIIVKHAINIGFKCIEIADRHIHLDDKDRGYEPILITGKSH